MKRLKYTFEHKDLLLHCPRYNVCSYFSSTGIIYLAIRMFLSVTEDSGRGNRNSCSGK
jgi:hypothetical protein